MKKKIFIIFIFVFFIIVLFFVNKSFSKYTFNNSNTRVFESSSFYFECSLNDNNNIYNINWDSDTPEEIDFEVDNFINNLLINTDDIKYVIGYRLLSGNASDINISLLDDEDNVVNNNSEYILSGETLSRDNYKLVINGTKQLDVGSRYSVEIQIKSLEPYIKDMIIIFNIEACVLDDYEYEIVDNSDYVSLKFQIFNKLNSDIEITFDSDKLFFDKSNDMYVSITDQSVILDKERLIDGNSYIFNFIKKSDFIVGVDDIFVR